MLCKKKKSGLGGGGGLGEQWGTGRPVEVEESMKGSLELLRRSYGVGRKVKS